MIGKHGLVMLFGVWAAVCQAVWPADWADHRSLGRFRLYADYPLDESRDVVAQLRQLERDLAGALDLPETSEPVHLILFRDRSSYERYMDRYFRGAPERRAMFIKGSMPGWVFAYRNPDLPTDLRHETVHALLHAQMPAVPLWLDEGIAEYYEVPAESRVYDNPYLSRVKRDAWLLRVPSLSELEQLEDMRQMDATDYEAAWSWVHFLLHGPPEVRRVLTAYLTDLREQRAAGTLHERLQAAIPGLEKQYLKHFRTWRR